MQQRKPPTSQAQLLEYFLSTEMEEMQYEVARCRPMVDAAFMQYLDTQIGKAYAIKLFVVLHSSLTFRLSVHSSMIMWLRFRNMSIT